MLGIGKLPDLYAAGEYDTEKDVCKYHTKRSLQYDGTISREVEWKTFPCYGISINPLFASGRAYLR